ncbi:LysM peptidoglycan-binding domain-containing protein [Actinotalea sp.]|uniref:LysM peptidoglycan-binding domain-containing protein n=1 Tax=Actinotalea sp. TaxID=1872145 RepID=UPI00356AB6AF
MTTVAPRPLAPSAARRRAVSGTGVGLALAAVSVAHATPAAAEEYQVRQGDTVSHIALRTSSSVAQIVQANNLGSSAFIRAGQTLTIPRETASATTAAPAAQASPAPSGHLVQAGDTVSHLAVRYGTSVAAIVSANGLDSRAMIRIGQTLTIPGTSTSTSTAATTTASTPTTATTATSYRVVAGDTVSRIAARTGTTTAAIVAANGLDSRALIRIGQTLTIPGTSTSTTATTTATLVGNTFAGRTYPAATVSSANQNKATLLQMGVPSTAEMQALVRSTAQSMGVDPALAQAVAFQESGFNHASVSPANAIGTMQVIPTSGEWASDMVGRELNLLDPTDNVVAGVAILRRLVATSPDLSSAIAGYYQGQASVSRNGMFSDTRRYVANVRTLMSRFS